MDRLRDAGPCGRFFGDRDDTRMGAIGGGVHPLQEGDGSLVLASTLLIRYPLASFARIIEIEHGGDGIDPQTVGMETLHPIERIVDEEGLNFGAAEIIDGGVPVGVEAAARVVMLIERGAVEMRQPVLVGRKMRRYPVEDDAEPQLMRAVD